MKKSNKKQPNIEDMIDDVNNLLKFVENLNQQKFEDIDLNEVNEKTNVFSKKYKDILPEESKEDLDSKE
tara:strand:+ start:256 stop:462 length:207 start_codon:yes stop_codon:yes gene_type:complete